LFSKPIACHDKPEPEPESEPVRYKIIATDETLSELVAKVDFMPCLASELIRRMCEKKEVRLKSFLGEAHCLLFDYVLDFKSKGKSNASFKPEFLEEHSNLTSETREFQKIFKEEFLKQVANNPNHTITKFKPKHPTMQFSDLNDHLGNDDWRLKVFANFGKKS
jgi:hypothetical protein